MANVDRPKGATAIRQLDGGKTIPVNPYTVDSSNGTEIFPGDFVKLEADGNAAPAAAGDEILGVCVDVLGDYDDLKRRYLPKSTSGTILVADSPYTMFEVQEDDGGTALTSAARGALVDIVAGTGSTTTSISAHELDQDSVGTADGQLRLHWLSDRENNDYGDNADWVVTINEHLFKGTDGV